MMAVSILALIDLAPRVTGDTGALDAMLGQRLSFGLMHRSLDRKTQ
jgi:hypothetical protein